ncbi:MAG: hypothetical protein R2749_29835 [Acidimicrobiales bacterium]
MKPRRMVRIPIDLYDELREAADERLMSVDILATHMLRNSITRLVDAADLRLTVPRSEHS